MARSPNGESAVGIASDTTDWQFHDFKVPHLEYPLYALSAVLTVPPPAAAPEPSSLLLLLLGSGGLSLLRWPGDRRAKLTHFGG